MTDDTQPTSFEREALPHLDTVYRVALRLTADPSRADDLVQDTMLKAYRAWPSFTPGTNARAWLLTILRNQFINDYRRDRQRGPTVDIAAIEPYTVFHATEGDPAGRFFDQLVDDEVVAAIGALPAEFREVVVLSDLEGLSYAEIAEVVGAPVGTVKSRLHRGRQALQRQLYDYAVAMGYIRGRHP
jgi:RNA polymerase sigma-70 factor (ECF subfamily)